MEVFGPERDLRDSLTGAGGGLADEDIYVERGYRDILYFLLAGCVW